MSKMRKFLALQALCAGMALLPGGQAALAADVA
ncbi:hypothetical protein SAMN05444581_1151, partial [Methylocapsa palsarum]